VKDEPSEFDRFTSLVDRVLSVPHSVIKERIEEHRRQTALNPHRPRDRSPSANAALRILPLRPAPQGPSCRSFLRPCQWLRQRSSACNHAGCEFA